MRIILVGISLLFSTFVFAQDDSIPVNKTLKDKPVPNYPDTNSIYKAPDTNAIYKEEQGYPDNKKLEQKGQDQKQDAVKIKSGKKPSNKNISPDKTKVPPLKTKKSSRDTTGNGTKQNF